jgi:hypothetical protein
VKDYRLVDAGVAVTLRTCPGRPARLGRSTNAAAWKAVATATIAKLGGSFGAA